MKKTSKKLRFSALFRKSDNGADSGSRVSGDTLELPKLTPDFTPQDKGKISDKRYDDGYDPADDEICEVYAPPNWFE